MILGLENTEDALFPMEGKPHNLLTKESRCIVMEHEKSIICNSFSRSLPSRWQMSPPVGGQLDIKTVQQTNWQNLSGRSGIIKDQVHCFPGLRFRGAAAVPMTSSRGQASGAANPAGGALRQLCRPSSELRSGAGAWGGGWKKQWEGSSKAPKPRHHWQQRRGEARPLCQAPHTALHADQRENIPIWQVGKLLNARNQHSPDRWDNYVV